MLVKRPLISWEVFDECVLKWLHRSEVWRIPRQHRWTTQTNMSRLQVTRDQVIISLTLLVIRGLYFLAVTLVWDLSTIAKETIAKFPWVMRQSWSIAQHPIAERKQILQGNYKIVHFMIVLNLSASVSFKLTGNISKTHPLFRMFIIMKAHRNKWNLCSL